jgi:hypothetical protein
VLNPRAPGAAEALALLGVTAIITHPDALLDIESAQDVPNADWGPGYELVARGSDGSAVWRVVATAAPALVTLPGGFGAPVAVGDDLPGLPLTSPSGVGVIGFTAKASSTVQLEFDAQPATDGQVIRLADDDTELPFELAGVTSISVLVDVPRGRSFILVKVDPAATSPDDAVVLTKPRATRASGTPELVAETISTEPGF